MSKVTIKGLTLPVESVETQNLPPGMFFVGIVRPVGTYGAEYSGLFMRTQAGLTMLSDNRAWPNDMLPALIFNYQPVDVEIIYTPCR